MRGMVSGYMFEINCVYCNETMTNVMTRVELTTHITKGGGTRYVRRDLVLLNCLKWRVLGNCATFLSRCICKKRYGI